MKLELPTPTSDEAVLSLSAAASGVAALQYGLAPRQAHHTFFFAPSEPYSEVALRSLGLCAGGLGGVQLAVSASEGSRSAKKHALKAAGAFWMATGAVDAYWANNGMARKESKTACAAASLALGTLCLWRGFSKEGSTAGNANKGGAGEPTATAGATDSRATGRGSAAHLPSAGGALARG